MTDFLPIVPVVLCGGSGTRLWPSSRESYPKQFLTLHYDRTLFQQAIARMHASVTDAAHIAEMLVITNEAHRFLCQDQLHDGLDVVPARLMLEPTGKNTAPALTLAALAAIEKGEDPILIVTPADQVVTNTDAFSASMRQCVLAAENGDILVMGTTAISPETGYGYIQKTGSKGLFGEYQVSGFTEKPDRETAEQYLKSGDFTWNSGIFVLRATTWLKALEHFQPDMYSACCAAWETREMDGDFVRFNREMFNRIPSESIDYAVIEHCTSAVGASFNVKMVPLDAGWSDLGAWDAVWQNAEKDNSGNATRGDTLLSNTQDSLVLANHRLVSVAGMDNVIVIETADAVLIADKNNSQSVKQIVQQLQALQREEASLHRKVYRPWGWYDSIDAADRFKVKRIQVKPGASLSLQKHNHRAEHWIVVKGTAEVTSGDSVQLLSENQSTYIPLGQTHRLANPGKIPLEIIEVQSGSYLGEDDIIRLNDNYGRK